MTSTVAIGMVTQQKVANTKTSAGVALCLSAVGEGLSASVRHSSLCGEDDDCSFLVICRES